MKLKLSKKIQLSIPKPCHENWEEMSPVEKGNFCSVCSKTVYDFTKASDEEIITRLHQKKNTCGRFSTAQLNRDIYVSKHNSSYWTLAVTSMIGFLGVGIQNSYTQVKPDTIQTASKQNFIKQKVLLPQKRSITGVVSDEIGPLTGVSIRIKGNTNGTTSDFEGKYSLEVQNGDEITFHFLGAETQSFLIKNEVNTYNVRMDSAVLTGDVIVIDAITRKRKTFLGRNIQKIKNWFR